jgi:hypothetical protein
MTEFPVCVSGDLADADLGQTDLQHVSINSVLNSAFAADLLSPKSELN